MTLPAATVNGSIMVQIVAGAKGANIACAEQHHDLPSPCEFTRLRSLPFGVSISLNQQKNKKMEAACFWIALLILVLAWWHELVIGNKDDNDLM